jgi:hypothetical protein
MGRGVHMSVALVNRGARGGGGVADNFATLIRIISISFLQLKHNLLPICYSCKKYYLIRKYYIL